jgi:hypothetical protein
LDCAGVTVAPGFVSLQPLATQQFTATVTGATDTSVTWSASDCCITSAGVFTAPATAGTYTVTATSVENPAQSGTASVAVQAQIAVAVSPTTVTLTPGHTRQFTATVTGTPNTAVTWTATGGTISQAGLYTAGTTHGSFVVTATSAEDSTRSASASVTIVSGGVTRNSSRGFARASVSIPRTGGSRLVDFQGSESAGATVWSATHTCSGPTTSGTATTSFTESYAGSELLAVTASFSSSATSGGGNVGTGGSYDLDFSVAQTTTVSIDARFTANVEFGSALFFLSTPLIRDESGNPVVQS